MTRGQLLADAHARAWRQAQARAIEQLPARERRIYLDSQDPRTFNAKHPEIEDYGRLQRIALNVHQRVNAAVAQQLSRPGNVTQLVGRRGSAPVRAERHVVARRAATSRRRSTASRTASRGDPSEPEPPSVNTCRPGAPQGGGAS